MRNWKAAHSRVTPTIASPPTCPAPPGPPDPTSPDPTHLNNKQSRMCSGARRTSAVLHRPSLMKPTAYSKDFFPAMHLFAAFVYRVSFICFFFFFIIYIFFFVCFSVLISRFGRSVHELWEGCSGSAAAWTLMLFSWIPCAISGTGRSWWWRGVPTCVHKIVPLWIGRVGGATGWERRMTSPLQEAGHAAAGGDDQPTPLTC